jgi:predicted RNase H-like HicB family nuclease
LNPASESNGGKMASRKTYPARFELDENGYWSVVSDVGPGKTAISDGQTLPKARRRIRQSIALLLEVSEGSFDIREDVNLPRKAMTSLRRYQGAQKKLRQDTEEAAQAERAVAQVLAKLGISRRDAGDLLGLSGARIQQVLNES